MDSKNYELQIELAEIRIDHQYITSTFMGTLAMEFGAIIGLASIFYGLYGKSVYFLIPIVVVILMVAVLLSAYYTLRLYTNERERLKSRIGKLRKKYISQQTSE